MALYFLSFHLLHCWNIFLHFFSSPDQRSWWAIRIAFRPSVCPSVRLSWTVTNSYFSKTTSLIVMKLHHVHQGKGGTTFSCKKFWAELWPLLPWQPCTKSLKIFFSRTNSPILIWFSPNCSSNAWVQKLYKLCQSDKKHGRQRALSIFHIWKFWKKNSNPSKTCIKGHILMKFSQNIDLNKLRNIC